MRLLPPLPCLLRHAILLLCVLLVTPALALPAPMSDSDLFVKSDLVALVRVLSVTCLEREPGRADPATLPNYSAKLELIEVIKGDEAKGATVSVSFHAVPNGLLGPWTVYYYPGEMVWTHLEGHNGDYTTTWWNGRGDIVSKAVITELPTTPGETVTLAAPQSTLTARRSSCSRPCSNCSACCTFGRSLVATPCARAARAHVGPGARWTRATSWRWCAWFR